MKIYTVGGYNEVGKNMTVVESDNEAVIFDIGLFMEKIVDVEEDEQARFDSDDLIKIGAIPDDNYVKNLNVKAIVIGHAHLDHIGALPYLASKYKCPIIGTPYTIEILKAIIKDKGLKLKNDIKILNINSHLKISDNLKIEFVNITHSVPQTVIVALHTNEGIAMYANDFKLDDTPVLGKKPDYEKLKQLGEKGIKVVIVDSTRADEDGKTPSESVAKEMLRDVLFSINDNAIFVTTFASQIQRLKSVMEFGKRMNRKVVFLGRSMEKYTKAAEKLNLVNFKGVDIVGYGNKIKKKLRDINKNKERYLVACTGNQGEPKSVLSKIANDELRFKFEEGDSVIFSCNTIPTETNIRNREIIEKKLKDKKVRLFKDVHTSGHCRREDLRKFLMLIKAENIIPSHGTQDKLKSVKDLAEEISYKDGKNVFVSKDTGVIVL